MWLGILFPSAGVHDARTSNSESSSLSSSDPKEVLDTRVTVPLGSIYAQSCFARASMSHVQPILETIGSVAISSSTAALTKVTHRNLPSHPSCPAGSWRRTKRAVAASSNTSAVRAKAWGASFDGAGTSSNKISERGMMVRIWATISSNVISLLIG